MRKMRAQQKFLVSLVVCFAMLISFAFADVPENDTVNISLRINTIPNITVVILDDFDDNLDEITLNAGTNETVYCIVNATDFDGYDNLNMSSLNVSIYHQASGYGATNNPKYRYNLAWNDTTYANACLNQSHDGGASYEGTIVFNCSISMPYYAENGTWICVAQIDDLSSGTPLHHINSDTATLLEMIALNITAGINDVGIDFGFIALGENASQPHWNTTIENIGNVPLIVNISATNTSDGTIDDTYGMNCNVSYINETDIWFNDDGTYDDIDSGSGNWYQLETGMTSADNMLGFEEAVDDDKVFYTIFWGLNLINSQGMTPQPKGACRGWLFFDAMIG